MPKPSKDDQSKREAPIQFRPGAELGHLIGAFAAEHGLHLNEACKSLIALSVVGLDCRFYDLMHQMADAMGGPNAFVRSCVHVDAALKGASRARGRPIQLDPERAEFVRQTVHDFLVGRGIQFQEKGFWLLPEPREPAELGEDPDDKLKKKARRVMVLRPGQEAQPTDQAGARRVRQGITRIQEPLEEDQPTDQPQQEAQQVVQQPAQPERLRERLR